MSRIRFHIGSLVILVLILGVALAALRESNDLWDSGVFSFTIGVLLISVVLALHRTGPKRAFWVGFALFGAVYLGLSLIPSIESRLITTKALAYVDSKLPRANDAGIAYGDFDSDGVVDLLVANDLTARVAGPNTGGWIRNPTTQLLSKSVTNGSASYKIVYTTALTGSAATSVNFTRIGHSLIALVAAFGGGRLSRHLARSTIGGQAREEESRVRVDRSG
jgi:hypothetical protein